MKYELQQTKQISEWLVSKKIKPFRARILARLVRVQNGHFSDYKQLNTNLYELRFFFGDGFRLYYTIHNKEIILLLIGGNKSSQSKDIIAAKEMLNK